MKRFATLCLAAAAASLLATPAAALETRAAKRALLRYDPQPAAFWIPPAAPPAAKASAHPGSAILVRYLDAGTTTSSGDTCGAWSQAAKDAFTYAANLWAAELHSLVTINVDACFASNLEAGIVAAAGPTSLARNFSTSVGGGAWYPIALANGIAGQDLNGLVAEIRASFNSTYTWYYGIDGRTPAGSLDFVTAAMHALGNGLGFSASMEVDAASGDGAWGEGTGTPARFDTFAETAGGQKLADSRNFPNPGPALGAALRSDSLFFNGPGSRNANGGARVALHAPAVWSEGSSFTHLGQVYRASVNGLMTHMLAPGTGVHQPGPLALEMMRDLGWPLHAAPTADLTVVQTVNPSPAAAGRDVVFTLNALNQGPDTAADVRLSAAYDPSATVVWASPGCVKQGSSAVYVCAVGTLPPGLSNQFKLVLRKNAAGSLSNTLTVAADLVVSFDPAPSNDSATATVNVAASPAGVPVNRYRLYSPVSLEHHFTTDLNEYNTLGTYAGIWQQEGSVGKVLDNPGSLNGVAAVPYYRLYDNQTRWHHWTTDPNEYYTLIQFPWWSAEGVDGFIFPTQAPGTTALFRLLFPAVAGLHHWTIDAYEYGVLTSQYGWVGEGGSGYVIP